MHLIDWILLAVIAVIVLLALRQIRKNKGSCQGDCASCLHNCGKKES